MNSINLLVLALVILVGSFSEAFSLYSLNSYLNPINQYSSIEDDNTAKLTGHRTFYDFKAFDNDVFNKTLCYFHQDMSYLICYGFGEVSRCEITSDFGKDLLNDVNVFGLELIESIDLPSVKFALHPLNQLSIIEKKWLRASVNVDNTPLDISITYVNSSFFDLGVQVQNLECFQKMVNLARISKKTQLELIDGSSCTFFGGFFVTRDEESSNTITERYSLRPSFDIGVIYNYFNSILQAFYKKK